MECIVSRENNMLQVGVTIRNNEKPDVSEKINFHGTLTFQVKQMNLFEKDRFPPVRGNIVLINIAKRNVYDKFMYKVNLSCPELKVHKSIFSSDEDNQWHLLYESSQSYYNFNITLTVESVCQINFSVLYEDEQLTDFKLKCHDGEIDIHKAFLAAVSTVFRSKLDNLNETIDFLEIPATSMNTLIDFKKCIYTEVLPDKNIEELLLLAIYFEILWLQYRCIDVMLRNISTSDAMDLLEFAIKHQYMPLLLSIMHHVQVGCLNMSDIYKHYLQNKNNCICYKSF